MGGTENLPVGPGILGFIAVFVLAVALWFLMRNMNARMRRMAYRERDRVEQERREQAEREGFVGGGDVTYEDPTDSRRPDDGSSPDGRGPAPRA